MKLEEAIPYLRKGYRIFRKDNLHSKGYLQGSMEKPFGSFYLTLWDVLSEDWEVLKMKVNISSIENGKPVNYNESTEDLHEHNR